MKNYIYLSLIIAITAMQFSYGAHGSADVETHGVSWQRDFFGNVLPDVRSIPFHELEAKLAPFLAALQTQEKGNAFIVHLPHDQAGKAIHLRKLGFIPHHIDKDRTEWVIKNGSPMPEAATAAAGVRVLICRDQDVLVIEDKNIKGRMMFPGGSVDTGELALDAASREIKEEVDLVIKSTDLQKIALVNRVRANKYGTSDYCHYYIARIFTGTPKAQESEISQLFWYPLASLAKGESTNNLKVSPTTKLLAAHVLSNGDTTSVRVIDPRQYAVAPDKQNKADVMDIDLFAFDKQSKSRL